MSAREPLTLEDHRCRLAVRRLLDAVDRALAAAREVAAARAALDRAALRTPRLRALPMESENTDGE
jgi:hypothetical protein